MPGPRILLVGAGSMGSLHARVISSSTGAELAALVDPREHVGRDVADISCVEISRHDSCFRQIEPRRNTTVG